MFCFDVRIGLNRRTVSPIVILCEECYELPCCGKFLARLRVSELFKECSPDLMKDWGLSGLRVIQVGQTVDGRKGSLTGSRSVTV
jgi:hypothetical protein